MKKLVSKLAIVVSGVVLVATPAVAAIDWGTWGPIPVKFNGTKALTPGDTTISFAFDSAFKPVPQNSSGTTSTLDVEWDFFLGTFSAGYGTCTTNSTPGAYDCPGGITVQVTQPAGDPYTVAAVELVDRTDWTVWNVTPFTAPIRAAALVVRWTSETPSNFSDTLTEVHFPADSINLPSEADQERLEALFFEGAAMFNGAGGFETSRYGFTQYTAGAQSFGSGNSGGGGGGGAPSFDIDPDHYRRRGADESALPDTL